MCIVSGVHQPKGVSKIHHPAGQCLESPAYKAVSGDLQTTGQCLESTIIQGHVWSIPASGAMSGSSPVSRVEHRIKKPTGPFLESTNLNGSFWSPSVYRAVSPTSRVVSGIHQLTGQCLESTSLQGSV